MLRAASDLFRVANGASAVLTYQVELLTRAGRSAVRNGELLRKNGLKSMGVGVERKMGAEKDVTRKVVGKEELYTGGTVATEESPVSSSVLSSAAAGKNIENVKDTTASREADTVKASSETDSVKAVLGRTELLDRAVNGASHKETTVSVQEAPVAEEKHFTSVQKMKPTASEREVAAAAAAGVEKSQTRTMRATTVPASSLSRAVGFGSLGIRLFAGAASEATRRVFSNTPEAKSKSVYLTQANAERIAASLSRMRGAALKLGQMISIQDKDLLPEELSIALETVRQNADYMPTAQLQSVMANELGTDWKLKFESFEMEPIAAASIGQVHRARLVDGTDVAVKVQYPGVADSIESDLLNLKRLVTYSGFAPKSFYIDEAMNYAREELSKECDYEEEAEKQNLFRSMMLNDDRFVVPKAISSVSSKRVLTSEWVNGKPIDKFDAAAGYSQETRDKLGNLLMDLTLKELYVMRFMQTDPNFSNFFYDGERIALLDFGAARGYDKSFVDNYLQMVVACGNRDRDAILHYSTVLGFLTGDESKAMLDAHVAASFVVGEPFNERSEPYDFGKMNVAARAAKFGATLAKERLCPPPKEAYSLHRRLSGAFLICMRLGSRVRARDLLMNVYNSYEFGPEVEENQLQSAV